MDVVAIDLDFQHRVGEAAALAGVAGQGHIRHELHADGDAALAFTGLAAATAGVEAEHGRLVAPVSGQGLGGKQTAYIVPGLDIGGGVGPAALANGVLVDEFDHLDAVQAPGQPVAHTRAVAAEIEMAGEERVENALHQGALARARHTGHHVEGAEQEPGVDALEVVLLGVEHHHLPNAGPPVDGNRNAPAAIEVVRSERSGRFEQGREVAGEDDMPTFTACLGTEVHDMVCGADDGFFVLHDDNRVAQVPESSEDFDEPVGVVRVEADAGLIQDIRAAHQAAAEARAELDPLALAPAEGGASAVEGQVAQSHVEEELQTVTHLEKEAVSNFLLGGGQGQPIEDDHNLLNGQAEEVGQSVTVNADIPRFRPEAASSAVVARCAAAVPAEHHPVLDLVALGFEAGEEVVDATPGTGALPQLAPLLGGQVGIGGVHGKVLVIGILQHALLVPAGLVAPPWGHAVLVHTLGWVRDDQVLADPDDMTEAFAPGTGSLGIVETEQVRGGNLEGHAVELEAVTEGLDFDTVGCDPMKFASAMSFVESRVHRVGEPLLKLLELTVLGPGESVDDQVKYAFRCVVLLKRGQHVGNGGRVTGVKQTGESLLLPDFQLLSEGPVRWDAHWGTDHEALARGTTGGGMDHISHRVLSDLLSRLGAERSSDSRPQQLEVVVHLGDGTDCGPATARSHALFDGNGRGEVVDSVHIRLLQPTCELAHVGAEALHIATLAFGVEGVEGERALAGTTEARDYGQLPQGEVDVDIAEVVDARTTDSDAVRPAGVHR